MYKTSFATLQLQKLLFTVHVTTLVGSLNSGLESVVLAVLQTSDDLICSRDIEAVSELTQVLEKINFSQTLSICCG